MSKIQSIKRPNGTEVLFVYLSKEVVERSGFVKGDEVFFKVAKNFLEVVKK